jgi:hypothetical protein
MGTSKYIRRFAAGGLALALVGIGGTASADQTVAVDGDGARGPNAFLFRCSTAPS